MQVRNRGPAIAPSALHRIFEPLERESATPGKADHRDTLGLGLYIAREIALGHRGEITVRSDEDETVFTVRLPRSGCSSA
ncbi:sensor histidine kinase [Cupriavidus plantarum]|uniref:sensor histidine kinase n=1 Tax=Cupriavidus plantarum TaxID=942865 RepID=UPI00339D801D